MTKKNEEYYDNVKLTEEFDFSKKKRIKAKTKRVNMLIPNSVFEGTSRPGR